MLELCRKYNAIEDGDQVLEVGTGWVHWMATVLRLFYKVEVTVFDVWDNRQLAAYKHYCEQLRQAADKVFVMEPAQREQVYTLLDNISAANTFDELYRMLGFEYLIDPTGALKQFGNDSFDLIVSADVLEHIRQGILLEFVRDSYRVLKPGGYSIHQIDLSDHLSHYDHTSSRKNYYRYSKKMWTRWLENEVQYFNRIQRSEWLNLFIMEGFELVEERPEFSDLGNIKINKDYNNLSQQDLECTLVTVIYRKPLKDACKRSDATY